MLAAASPKREKKRREINKNLSFFFLLLPQPLHLSPPQSQIKQKLSSSNTPGTFWATSVTGVLAYQWTKPIPTNLKIIHARVAAQALTLAALAAAAAVDVYEHKAVTQRELERVAARLEHVEKKVHGEK